VVKIDGSSENLVTGDPAFDYDEQYHLNQDA